MMSALAVGFAMFLITCSQPMSVYDIVQASGRLVVLAKPQPGTLASQSSMRRQDFEVALVERFAETLAVDRPIQIVWRYEPNGDQLLQRLAAGEANMGVGHLALTKRRDDALDFGPSILELRPQVVFSTQHSQKPKNVFALVNTNLVLPSGSGYLELLEQMQADIPNLNWQVQGMSEIDLLQAVASGHIDVTIAGATSIAQMQRYYPNLQVAFDLSFRIPTAWAFPSGNSRQLQAKAATFLRKLAASNELEKLQDAFYGHLDRHNESDLHRFNRLRSGRLPTYWSALKSAAEQYAIPPALLAALAYQESYWNPAAKSPTGVRGMMMLTRGTAKDMGVSDRTNAEQSIRGGAKYLALLKDKFSQKIAEPDLTWFALAAYNLGSGHVRDAMKLARDYGDGSSSDDRYWLNIKPYLLKLRDPAWHEKTYYGYARGDEAVHYVENIRSYYDLLQTFEPQLLDMLDKPEALEKIDWSLPQPEVRPILR